MFRTFTLAALITSSTMTATASGQRPAHQDRDHHRSRYRMLVRHRGHWDLHGTYRDRAEVERVAHRLEHRGLDARVERVR